MFKSEKTILKKKIQNMKEQIEEENMLKLFRYFLEHQRIKDERRKSLIINTGGMGIQSKK